MMRAFKYSEARQNLSKLLNIAENEEVKIRKKDGTIFSLTSKNHRTKPPFNVPGIKTKATTQDVLDRIRASRRG